MAKKKSKRKSVSRAKLIQKKRDGAFVHIIVSVLIVVTALIFCLLIVGSSSISKVMFLHKNF